MIQFLTNFGFFFGIKKFHLYGCCKHQSHILFIKWQYLAKQAGVSKHKNCFYINHRIMILKYIISDFEKKIKFYIPTLCVYQCHIRILFSQNHYQRNQFYSHFFEKFSPSLGMTWRPWGHCNGRRTCCRPAGPGSRVLWRGCTWAGSVPCSVGSPTVEWRHWEESVQNKNVYIHIRHFLNNNKNSTLW